MFIKIDLFTLIIIGSLAVVGTVAFAKHLVAGGVIAYVLFREVGNDFKKQLFGKKKGG